MPTNRARTVAATALSAAAVLAIGGCSSDSGDISTTPADGGSTSNSAVSPNKQNKDINVGDTFTVFNPYGQGILANVTYEGSEIDPPTNGEPEGHALGVHVVVDMTNSETPNLVSDSFEISEELPGGMTATEPADSKLVGYSFTDGRPKITEVKQGQKQDGWLLLDVKAPSGTLLWPLNPRTARLPYPIGPARSASPAATS